MSNIQSKNINTSFQRTTLEQFQARQYSIIPRLDAKGILELQSIIKRENQSPLIVFDLDNQVYVNVSSGSITNIGGGTPGTGVAIYEFSGSINLIANTLYTINTGVTLTDKRHFFAKAYKDDSEVMVEVKPIDTTHIGVEANTTMTIYITILIY